MLYKKTNENDKFRSWVFIAYKETMPIDFVDRLKKLLVPCAVSPLHSPEETEEGEHKPHYHVLLSFSSPASAKKVVSMLYSIEIERGIGGYRSEDINYSMIQPCNNFNSYVRYMCHLDQPDKQQLKWDNMVALNGIDIDACLNISFSRQLEFSNEIIDFCNQADIYYFCDLVEYARVTHYDDWFVYLKDNCYFIKEYLRSKSSKREYKVKKALLSEQERERLKLADDVAL